MGEGGWGGGGASFSMMSAFGRTSVGWHTNQSRPHPIIHWLPEDLKAACRTSPLELSHLLTEALKKSISLTAQERCSHCSRCTRKREASKKILFKKKT